MSFKRTLMIFAALAGIFLFYWFQIRPSDIKISCSKQATNQAREINKKRASMLPDNATLQKSAENDLYQVQDYDNYYQKCLQEKGL